MHVRVRMLVSVSPYVFSVSFILPRQLPLSVSRVSFFPCSYCAVRCVKGVRVLKAPRLGQRAGRSERGQGRGTGRAKSFGEADEG